MVGQRLPAAAHVAPSGELIEYKVRPVTRYIVTRFERNGKMGSCGGSSGGEFDNYQTAYEVAYALCKADHERKGWPLGDERIQYPRHPDEAEATLETKGDEQCSSPS